jgi:hypothetical protein
LINNPSEERSDIDSVIVSIDEHEQKLRFAIWDYIEFLSEDLKIDDPQKAINIIQKSVNKSISEYSPADESFDEEYEDD